MPSGDPHDALKLQHRDVIVVAVIEQMRCKLFGTRSLRAFEDHGVNLFGRVAARAKLCDVVSGLW